MYLFHIRLNVHTDISRSLSYVMLSIVRPPTYMGAVTWIHRYTSTFLFHVNGIGSLAFVVISNTPVYMVYTVYHNTLQYGTLSLIFIIPIYLL
jgi:hypothetical protein